MIFCIRHLQHLMKQRNIRAILKQARFQCAGEMMQLCLKHLALGMAGQRGTEDVLMPAVFFIEMLKRLFADFPDCEAAGS